jgi:integrase
MSKKPTPLIVATAPSSFQRLVGSPQLLVNVSLAAIIALRSRVFRQAPGGRHLRNPIGTSVEQDQVDIAVAFRAAAFQRGHAGGEAYVFATEIGTPMYYRNVTKRGLDRAADLAGLNYEGVPKLTLHDLRHTFASHLIVDLGVDVVQVSRQLGHSKPSVTLDVYAGLFAKARHAEDIRQKMGSSAFGALLG